MNILLAEPQPALSNRIEKILDHKKYSVCTCQSKSEVFITFAPKVFDCIVMTLNLGKESVNSIVERIRDIDNQCKILIVIKESIGEVSENTWFLVDDYIKLHELNEILLHLELLKKRTTPIKTSSRFRHNDFIFDEETSSLTYRSNTLSLSKTERKILYALFTAKRTVDFQFLVDKVWNDYLIDGKKRLKDQVYLLRRKIKNSFNTKLILTVKGKGYRLK